MRRDRIEVLNEIADRDNKQMANNSRISKIKNKSSSVTWNDNILRSNDNSFSLLASEDEPSK